MSPAVSFPISGKCFDTDSSTPLEAIDVFLFNKTKNETHHGSDVNFTNLITNAQGEWQANLADFDDEYDAGDIIYITARNGQDTAILRTKVVGSSLIDQDLTMETLEPVMDFTKFLRIRLTDLNSDRDNTTDMVMPDYPRKIKNDKTTYPRVQVTQSDEEAERAGIGSTVEKVTATFEVIVHIWNKESDEQILKVDGVDRSETWLRDKIAREVSDVLRQRFLQDSNDKDPHIKKYWAYQRLRSEPQEFDEEEGIMHQEIEFQVFYIRQT